MNPLSYKQGDYLIVRHGHGTRIARYERLITSHAPMVLVLVHVPGDYEMQWTRQRINQCRIVRLANPIDFLERRVTK